MENSKLKKLQTRRKISANAVSDEKSEHGLKSSRSKAISGQVLKEGKPETVTSFIESISKRIDKLLAAVARKSAA